MFEPQKRLRMEGQSQQGDTVETNCNLGFCLLLWILKEEGNQASMIFLRIMEQLAYITQNVKGPGGWGVFFWREEVGEILLNKASEGWEGMDM